MADHTAFPPDREAILRFEAGYVRSATRASTDAAPDNRGNMRLTRLARLVIGTSVLACCAAIPAAASASVQISAGADGGDYIISVIGDEGSQNLDVTSTPTAISFEGNGEVTSAGAGCTGTNPVTCTIPGGDWSVVFTEVALGASADLFDASALDDDAGLFLDAGDGADDVIGSDFADYLVLGTGADFVSSLDGDDIVNVKDGASDGPPISCGAGSDLVIRDMNENYGGSSSCENGSPVLTSPGVTIAGDPRPGKSVQLEGTGTYNFFSFNGYLKVDWFTCATTDRQGCGPHTVLDAWMAYSPSPADVGRYLYATLTTGLTAYSYLGPLDSRDSPPVQILPAVAQKPTNVFSLGSFKTGKRGTLTVQVPGAGRLTAEPATGSSAAKRKKKKALVSTTSKTTAAAGSVSLPIKLTSAGKKKLKSKGKLRVKIKVSFTPNGGTKASKTTSVTFKLRKK